jgi:hypothetical protein
MRLSTAQGRVVLATLLAAAALFIVDTSARGPVLLAYAVAVPGFGWAQRLGLRDRADRLVVGVSLSVCFVVVVGQAMALLDMWSLSGGFLALAGAALAGVLLPSHRPAVRTRAVSSPAGADTRPPRQPLTLTVAVVLLAVLLLASVALLTRL